MQVCSEYHALLPFDGSTSNFSCLIINECEGFSQLCILKIRILVKILK